MSPTHLHLPLIINISITTNTTVSLSLSAASSVSRPPLMGRSPCCEKAHTNKGAWTKEEDDRLIAHIQAHGEGCWRSLPKAAGLLRCGKSCRLRWINYLRPDLKRGNFTDEEDELIIKLHSLLGNKYVYVSIALDSLFPYTQLPLSWIFFLFLFLFLVLVVLRLRWSLIAGRLPGRTDNEIKNYWNTHIRRKLLSTGIDPLTHRPINEPAAMDAAATISFNGVVKKEDMMSSGFGCKSRNPDEEYCPDLNLELRISQPHQQPSQPELESRERRMLCFYCSLGLEKSKECSCSRGSSNGSSDDFLGMKNGALDYRNLGAKRY